MNTFYVDESGSMTKKSLDNKFHKYFIICMVLTNNPKSLLRAYKRFVSSNIDELRKMDYKNKMFYKTGKFKELKGSSFNQNMKKKFMKFFCQHNLFSIYYICCNNENVESYFYSNTARAFNYLIKLSIEHNTKIRNIQPSINYFFIDERNIRTDTIATLAEYLNIELVTANKLQRTFYVEYCQSEVKKLIQIADVFSNIYYSYIFSGTYYDNEICYLRNNNYIKNELFFPIR